jgi:hypothetical protein
MLKPENRLASSDKSDFESALIETRGPGAGLHTT